MNETGAKGEPQPTALDRFLRLFSDVRAGEGANALILLGTIFTLLFAYYVLKTVREPLVLVSATEDLSVLTQWGLPSWLTDVILDRAGQKGTGSWATAIAAELGAPAPTIAEAVAARSLSARLEERKAAAAMRAATPAIEDLPALDVDAVGAALLAAKVCAYAQGFALMSAAQHEYGWKLNFDRIARIWRGGCIIRAGFLQKISEAYRRDRRLANLLLDPYFRRKVHAAQASWRKVVGLAADAGIPSPAFMSALSYYDSYRSERLPANLLQAQRDYFGAHTYERLDRPRGRRFHLDWPAAERRQVES